MHGHRLLGDSLGDHYRLAGRDEISENALDAKVAPATPPWQINREILGGAGKQAEPINALSIHSVNSLVDNFDFNMSINARGVFLMMTHTLDLLRKGEGKSIVNISSVNG